MNSNIKFWNSPQHIEYMKTRINRNIHNPIRHSVLINIWSRSGYLINNFLGDKIKEYEF